MTLKSYGKKVLFILVPVVLLQYEVFEDSLWNPMDFPLVEDEVVVGLESSLTEGAGELQDNLVGLFDVLVGKRERLELLLAEGAHVASVLKLHNLGPGGSRI